MAAGKKRRPRPVHVPTLVAISSHVIPEFGLSESMAVEAMRSGWAHPGHFNNLLDCADMLLLGASHKQATDAMNVAHLARDVLASVRDRKQSKGRLLATGEEWKALCLLVDVSRDFWSRTAGSLFEAAQEGLAKFRAEQNKKAA